MSSHNNLGPRHLPKWPVAILLSGLVVTAIVAEEHFHLRPDWFAVVGYIVLLFAVIVLSFRPAWGRRIFWSTCGILFGLHVLVGVLLVLLLPRWLHSLSSFLSVIIVSDLLLTMSVLWRMTIAKKQKPS